MKLNRIVLFCLLTIATTTAPAIAGEYTAGLGLGVAPDYEGSDDTTTVPLLMFRGEYESGRSFELEGTQFKLNVLADKSYSFGPLLNYRSGRDDVDNNRVDKMKDIDDAFEARVYGGVNIDIFLIGLEMLADISNEHEGTLVKATAGYRWKAMPDLAVSPGVFTTYADDDYMDTYFGVNAKNRGNSGLPGFEADGGLKDVGFNLSAHYTPWQNWGVMGVLSYASLLNDAKDSPIVDDEGDDQQMFFGVMATYRFDH